MSNHAHDPLTCPCCQSYLALLTPTEDDERIAREIAVRLMPDLPEGAMLIIADWAELYKPDERHVKIIAQALAAKGARQRGAWKSFATAPKDKPAIVWRKDAGIFLAEYCEAEGSEEFLWFTAHGEDLTSDPPTLWLDIKEPTESAR